MFASWQLHSAGLLPIRAALRSSCFQLDHADGAANAPPPSDCDEDELNVGFEGCHARANCNAV